MKNNIIFWNVDTQVDFIKTGAKLPVPDAESIKDNLFELTELARDENIQVVNTCDWHTDKTEEISESPDFVNTFPEHCMAFTDGAEFIEEVTPYHPFIIDYSDKNVIVEEAIQYRNIVIRKDKFDVFEGNPYTLELLNKMPQNIFVVYGVAENVCVNFAVRGLLKYGKEVYVIEDAIKGLPDIDSPRDEWESMGAKIITLEGIYTVLNNN